VPDDDDELSLPELPPMSLEDDDEETLGVDEELAEELEELVGAKRGEEVGLDDAEGPDDFDPLDLMGDLGEEEPILVDAEAAGDLVGNLGSEIASGGAEYGWTEDNEPADQDFDDPEEFLQPLPSNTDEDGGEVGIDLLLGEGDGDDDAVPSLPPLSMDEADEEALADDLDLSGDVDISLPELSYEAEARLMGSELPPPDAASKTERVLAEPVAAVAFEEGRWWAAGDGLFTGDAEGARRVAATGLENEELVSLAVRGDVLVVGTRIGGVLRARVGEAFVPINGWRSGQTPSVATHVAFDARGTLWMWAGGALYRSADLGDRWTGPVLPAPVVAVSIDGQRVVALCSTGGALALRISDDGERWAGRAVTGPSPEGRFDLAVRGRRVAIAREGDPDGPWVGEVDGDEEWSAASALAGAERVAWRGGALCAAMHFATQDRGVVIEQRRYAAGARRVLDLVEDGGAGADPDGSRRVLDLEAAPDGALYVATGVGVYRIVHQT